MLSPFYLFFTFYMSLKFDYLSFLVFRRLDNSEKKYNFAP